MLNVRGYAFRSVSNPDAGVYLIYHAGVYSALIVIWHLTHDTLSELLFRDLELSLLLLASNVSQILGKSLAVVGDDVISSVFHQ